MTPYRRNLLTVAVSVALLGATAASAQDAASFPNRPIKIVVPYPPGGSTDMLARLLGQKLSERMGQPIVVENKAGASGAIGAQMAAKSPADGYTLFLGTSTALSVNPHLNKSLPYDANRDFAPIVLATLLPSLVVVNNAVPVKSMPELGALLKTGPDKPYASSGNGTPAHLGAEVYKSMTNARMTHVPYKGGVPALTDLMGGQVNLMFAILPEVLPLVKDGKLRALAVTTAERNPLFPDLPTVAETVPGYELVGWYAFLAPAATPKPVLAKLNREFNAALQDKEVRDKLTAQGFVLAGGPPEKLSDMMKSESMKWKQVIEERNITSN